MKEFLILFITPRFWGAYIMLTLPLWICLATGVTYLTEERIKRWMKDK